MSKPVVPDVPFTRAALLQAGVTPRQFRGVLERGDARAVVHGAYAAAWIPDSTELRVSAVRLVCSDHHVVVDRTAAWLHGVDAYSYGELEVVPPVDVCAMAGRSRTRRTGVQGGTRDLVAADVMSIGGIVVTTPLRTAADLGCRLRRREAYAAMCQLARVHGLAATDFARLLRRFRRRRGVVQLRELVALLDPTVESAREAWTLLAIHDAGLPRPVAQHWIVIDGVPTYRLDFAYLKARVYVEYDGAETHDAVTQREDDKVRRAWLRDDGWTGIVIRRGDFTGEARYTWLRELRAALGTTYSSRRW